MQWVNESLKWASSIKQYQEWVNFVVTRSRVTCHATFSYFTTLAIPEWRESSLVSVVWEKAGYGDKFEVERIKHWFVFIWQQVNMKNRLNFWRGHLTQVLRSCTYKFSRMHLLISQGRKIPGCPKRTKQQIKEIPVIKVQTSCTN